MIEDDLRFDSVTFPLWVRLFLKPSSEVRPSYKQDKDKGKAAYHRKSSGVEE